MKNLFVILISSLFSLATYAQEDFKRFKFDIGLAKTSHQFGTNSETGQGYSFSVEPRYNIYKGLQLGYLYSTASLFKSADMNSDDALGIITSGIGTAEYHILNNNIRPFIGIGYGQYTTIETNISLFGQGVGSSEPYKRNGYLLRGGLNVGHLRLIAEYNKLSGKGLNVGDGFLNLKAAIQVGGGKN